MSPAAGAVASPNIWRWPKTYELENRALDPDGRIEEAMAAIRPWDGGVVLDVGCGTGFHLPRFAARAGRVIGVEPHAGLARAARSRVGAASPESDHGIGAGAATAPRAGGPRNVAVRVGAAQALPVPDTSVDVVHARFAYFFGRGCEPGLRELSRVLRRGGAAFVIDIDATASTYGRWFRRWKPSYDSGDVERFWGRHGFTREPLAVRWRFPRRKDLAAVLRIEFPPELAARFLAEHDGLEIDYAVNLWWRRY